MYPSIKYSWHNCFCFFFFFWLNWHNCLVEKSLKKSQKRIFFYTQVPCSTLSCNCHTSLRIKNSSLINLPLACLYIDKYDDMWWQISDLTSSLQKNWPTLACPSGNGVQFWTHEWEKHGICSESILKQHDYFEAALDLKQRANLLRALTNAGTFHIQNWFNNCLVNYLHKHLISTFGKPITFL